MVLLSSLISLALATTAYAKVIDGVAPQSRLRVPKAPAHPKVTNGTAFFDQWLDHSNHSLGTFKQKYWWADTYYAGKGSPVVAFTPGEVAAAGYQGYLTNATITGLFAEAIGGAVVLIEHRYWGDSSPYADLTTENLQYLTLDNSIHDLTNFAQNVHLPFDRTNSSRPDKAPWVLSGGSYSGALSAWTESVAPGTYWAYHASSAPVEAISDYWAYFYPVQEGMPKNCSSDLSKVIDHIDGVLLDGTSQEKHNLKAMFGLQDIEHDDDFGAALENGPWLWQSNQFYANGGFFAMCDAVEGVVKNSTSAALPDVNGVGMQKALKGYANWFNTTFLPGYCESFGYPEYKGTYNTYCFDTYDAQNPMFTDRAVSSAFDRQWQWFLCNEPFGYWQDGAPAGRPSLVSRLVTAAYWQRQCALFFPAAAGAAPFDARNATEATVNAHTGGWQAADAERLLYANGQFDPWREAGVSSDFRPGGPLLSSAQTPVLLIPGGYHCSDLLARNGVVNAGVRRVVDAEVAQIKTWVQQFPKSY